MSQPRVVVVDTDCALGRPGEKVDDGFALALAVASPELDLAAVTTVAGNVDVVTATDRTVTLLRRLGRADVPVHAGGGPGGSAAARLIAGLALADPGSVTVVALGPLSNVAGALTDPRVGDALAEVVVMGGRFLGGIQDPPEFNTSNDPWAAREVLEGRAPVRFVGLDVTSRMTLTPPDLDRLEAGGDAARYLADQAWARLRALAAHEGVEAMACPMHDPLAVLALTHPGLLTFAPALVDVRTHGADRGRTAAVMRTASPARVAVDVDGAAAKGVLLDRLAALP